MKFLSRFFQPKPKPPAKVLPFKLDTCKECGERVAKVGRDRVHVLGECKKAA